MRASLAILATGAMLLSACGPGSSFDTAFRKSYREKFISSCQQSAGAGAPAAQSALATRLCTCTVDKIMKDVASSTLMSLDEARAATAMKQCLAEQGMPVPGAVKSSPPTAP